MPDREGPARKSVPSVQPPAGDNVAGAIQPFGHDCKHDEGFGVGWCGGVGGETIRERLVAVSFECR